MFLSTRFSTFFVAALDASINERQEADYVCDGVADDVTVEAAITPLAAHGGTVDVSAATTSAKIFVWEGATFVSQVFAGGTIDAPLNLSHVNAGTFNIILGR